MLFRSHLDNDYVLAIQIGNNDSIVVKRTSTSTLLGRRSCSRRCRGSFGGSLRAASRSRSFCASALALEDDGGSPLPMVIRLVVFERDFSRHVRKVTYACYTESFPQDGTAQGSVLSSSQPLEMPLYLRLPVSLLSPSFPLAGRPVRDWCRRTEVP